jgi:hypothetical protein
MTWVRIDDHLHAHPKFRLAWEIDPTSVGLELFALSHSAAYLTDGMVDDRFVRPWFRSAHRRQRAVDALVEAGLWVPDGSVGWQIHDYLDYNESREQVEERRRRDLARKRTPSRRVSS